MKIGKMTFRQVEWDEFCNYIQGKKLISSIHEDAQKVLLTFADNTHAVIQSEYEADWSNITPGDGVQPPTAFVQV